MVAEIASDVPTAGPLALAARAVAEVFRNPDLRNLQLASASFVTGEWAYTVAVSVYAYRYGGAAWVGIVGFIRMMPAAFSGLPDELRGQRCHPGAFAWRRPCSVRLHEWRG